MLVFACTVIRICACIYFLEICTQLHENFVCSACTYINFIDHHEQCISCITSHKYSSTMETYRSLCVCKKLKKGKLMLTQTS